MRAFAAAMTLVLVAVLAFSAGISMDRKSPEKVGISWGPCYKDHTCETQHACIFDEGNSVCVPLEGTRVMIETEPEADYPPPKPGTGLSL